MESNALHSTHGGKRSGAGRKPTNKTKVCLALKQDTAEAISTLSEKLGIDKSSVVDNAVREYENKIYESK